MATMGAYGKMPSLGDFIRIGLPNAFIGVWDRWLQDGLTELRDRLGERWETCYMSAPIWRFSLSAGVAGERAALGVMMPSVDRVGRKFPLTLAVEQGAPQATLTGHFAADALFAQLEEIAIGALADDMTLDLLKDRLRGVDGSGQEPPRFAARASDTSLVARVAGTGSLIPALAASLCEAHRMAASIWSMCVDGDARVMTCPGLPAGPSLTGLVDLDAGHWVGLEP